MLRSGIILSTFFVALFISGCSQSDRNEVNIYSHRHYPIDREIFETFTEKTGIEVNVVSASADELITKLELEGERSPADILITVDAGRLHKARELGLLQPFESAVLDEIVPERFRDSHNFWFGYTYRARAIAYAPDRIESEMVATYEALANPELKDRVIMRSSENAYNQSLMASILAHKGPELGAEWCRGLTGNFGRQPRGNDRDQIKAVAAGQGDVTVCNTYYVAKLAESPSAEERAIVEKIAILFPNQQDRGTHINISGAGLTHHAPNKKNAIALMEYLVSREVQEKLSVQNHEYPVREDVPLSPFLEDWGQFLIDSLPLEQLGIHNEEAVRIIDECGWM